MKALSELTAELGISEFRPETEKHPWKSLAQDSADIMAEELPEVVQVIEGIVCDRSKLLIGSGSKSYKTWLTIDAAVSIAHGVEFLGRVCIKTKVLYVNLELKDSTFKRRIQKIALEKRITLEPGQLTHLPLRGEIAGFPLSVVVDRVIAMAKDLGARVIVVDPVYKLNTVGDENSAKEMTELFNQLDRMTTDAQATVILNDHFGKGNQSEKDPLDAIRGSSAKGGDVDAAMVLRRHEVDECFRVDMVHRELPPVPAFTIGWNFPLMEIRPDLDPDAMKKPKGGRTKQHDPRRLVAAIRETTPENGISISAWAEKADIKRQTLNGYLPNLRKSEWIRTIDQKNGHPLQCITEKGIAAVAELEGAE